MTHLLNELQARHDRRLQLAERKRKREDDHVTLMRKSDEEAIWSWWKVLSVTYKICSTTNVA